MGVVESAPRSAVMCTPLCARCDTAFSMFCFSICFECQVHYYCAIKQKVFALTRRL